MRTRPVRKYFRILGFAMRDQLVYLPSFLVRNLFFLVIVFIFWSLWKVIYAGRSSVAGLTLVQTLWYLTFTETIELSKGRVFVQVQEEVRDGTLSVALTKPYGYPLYHLSRSLGESLVRIVPILVEGFLLGLLLVGPLPGYAASLPMGLVLIVAGLVLSTTWMLLIGLLSFWLEEVGPFYWILQKLVFILGGMFIPINLFPGWLGGIAKALPFAFSAYWPAYTMVTGSRDAFVTGLLGALGWTALFGAAVALVYARGRRRVQAQGG
jgi:ABC-2 type transport system permease protein